MTTLNGILLIDKPLGASSNHILQRVKRLVQADKAGHTGSLDPLASGMLPICCGEATKFSSFLLEADKRYRVTAELGVRTETSDAEGAIVATKPVPALTASLLTDLLAQFSGAQQQVPSMYSALKHQGQPLYKYARQGITVERPARPITIYELILVAHTATTLTLEVHCSKGTYIRTLVDDIGEALGCGAHVSMLRRLSVGQFAEHAMITLPALQSCIEDRAPLPLLPLTDLFQGWPCYAVTAAEQQRLVHGLAIMDPHGLAADTQIVLLGIDGHFLGIAQVLASHEIISRRLISTKGLVGTAS